MKILMYSIVLYFPLVLAYKLFANPYNLYWANTYWFMISIDYIFLFIGVRKLLLNINLINEKSIKVYRDICLLTSIYWGIMAVVRLYIYFNIDKYSQLISSAGKLTIGGVCIAILFIYLTAKIWYKK